jgi:hypothetical protein
MPSNGASKNPSAPQVDAATLETLRGIALALLSDNLHRSIGSVGLQPYHRPKHMAGTTTSPFCEPSSIAVPVMSW